MKLLFVEVLEDQFAVLEGDPSNNSFSYDVEHDLNVVLHHEYFAKKMTSEEKNRSALLAAMQFDPGNEGDPEWSERACRFLPMSKRSPDVMGMRISNIHAGIGSSVRITKAHLGL